MTVRAINLTKVGAPTKPALRNFDAGKVANAVHVHQMMAAQDRPFTSGRRILMRAGIRGAADNLTPETDPATGSTSSTHFDDDTPYEYTRARVYVQPGHAIAWRAWVLPASHTQDALVTEPVTYDQGGNVAKLIVSSTWDSRPADTDYTTSETVTLPVSAGVFGALPAFSGGAHSAMFRRDGFILPAAAGASLTVMRNLSRGTVVVDILLELLGGARLVDFVAYEFPYVMALDDADDPIGHVYSDGQNPRTSYPYEYPVEGPGSGDERFSLARVVEAANNTPKHLGPTILHWSAGTDDDAVTSVTSFGSGFGTGLDYMVPVNVTNTSYQLLNDIGTTRTANSPAASLRCGIYGRDHKTSATEHVLRQGGVIRVHLAAYVAGYTAGDVLRVRLYVNPWSSLVLEITAADTNWGWHDAVGWLDCGTVPEVDPRMWIEVEVDSADQFDVGSVCVSHMPDV